jgi:polyhydroxyalkanoate synthase subunit PhaC
MFKAISGLSLPLPQLAQIQNDYISSATALWNASLQSLPGASTGAGAGRADGAQTQTNKPQAIGDRRFGHEAWHSCIC